MASIGTRLVTRSTRARYSCDECALRNVTLEQADHAAKTPGCPGVIDVVIGC